MDNNQANIDQIIKQKLDQFEAAPPGHVWAGIEQGLLDEKLPFFLLYARQLIAAAVLVFAALALWYFIPVNDNEQQRTEIEMIDTTEQVETEIVDLPDVEQESREIEEQKSGEIIVETNAVEDILVDEIADETTTEKTSHKQVSSGTVAVNPPAVNSQGQKDQDNTRKQYLTYLDNKEISSIQLSDNQVAGTDAALENEVNFKNRKSISIAALSSVENEIPEFNNYWNIGLYFTPEMMFNNIDSVTLMNTYSVNIEPSWYFSKHWFMRFGAGVSYVRDRGFAKVDFISKDYMGSYDSVVNITFEEINNELYPVYHTKEVDIWDSIRHLNISEVTNSYYYLQIPLMFGYHNSTSKFKWYFYGGPAMNISISEHIEDPSANIDYIEIVDLENRLPNRTNYSIQLWLGAGIDFRIGQKFSLAFEPNYRYYFEPIYKENSYKTALSGLGLRFGLVYKLDRK